jgi:hypothetical protein
MLYNLKTSLYAEDGFYNAVQEANGDVGLRAHEISY